MAATDGAGAEAVEPAEPPACPEGRISRSTRQVDGRAVIDQSTYVPYFLVAVNTALSRSASQLYLSRFGVGILEWRVMSMLAAEPGIPAARICRVISLDKAATSRALGALDRLGHLEHEAPRADPRRRVWRLSPSGYALHDRIIAVALERERTLIAGVAPEELETFLKVMRIMRRNVDRLARPQESASGHDRP